MNFGDEIYVSQAEHWVKAYSPDTLLSGGLGPCTAICVYDHNTKSGYMIHEASPIVEERIPFFLKDIVCDYKGVSGLEVHVTGTAICDGEDLEDELPAQREYVLRELYKVFSEEQVFVEWLPNNTMGELILYLEDGSYDIAIEGIEGLLR